MAARRHRASTANSNEDAKPWVKLMCDALQPFISATTTSGLQCSKSILAKACEALLRDIGHITDGEFEGRRRVELAVMRTLFGSLELLLRHQQQQPAMPSLAVHLACLAMRAASRLLLIKDSYATVNVGQRRFGLALVRGGVLVMMATVLRSADCWSLLISTGTLLHVLRDVACAMAGEPDVPVLADELADGIRTSGVMEWLARAVARPPAVGREQQQQLEKAEAHMHALAAAVSALDLKVPLGPAAQWLMSAHVLALTLQLEADAADCAPPGQEPRQQQEPQPADMHGAPAFALPALRMKEDDMVCAIATVHHWQKAAAAAAKGGQQPKQGCIGARLAMTFRFTRSAERWWARAIEADNGGGARPANVVRLRELVPSMALAAVAGALRLGLIWDQGQRCLELLAADSRAASLNMDAGCDVEAILQHLSPVSPLSGDRTVSPGLLAAVEGLARVAATRLPLDCAVTTAVFSTLDASFLMSSADAGRLIPGVCRSVAALLGRLAVCRDTARKDTAAAGFMFGRPDVVRAVLVARDAAAVAERASLALACWLPNVLRQLQNICGEKCRDVLNCALDWIHDLLLAALEADRRGDAVDALDFREFLVHAADAPRLLVTVGELFMNRRILRYGQVVAGIWVLMKQVFAGPEWQPRLWERQFSISLGSNPAAPLTDTLPRLMHMTILPKARWDEYKPDDGHPVDKPLLRQLLIPPHRVRRQMGVCGNPGCCGGGLRPLTVGCDGCGGMTRYCSRRCMTEHATKYDHTPDLCSLLLPAKVRQMGGL